MATRYHRGNQNPYIIRHATQWPQDTKGVIRIRIEKDRKHNGHNDYLFGILWPLCCLSFFDIRILITPFGSCGHCVFCPSIYGFWLPLWFFVGCKLFIYLVFFVFVFFVFMSSSCVLLDQCCQYLWIVNCWYRIRFSLTFFLSSQ
jgi:hypothetical protein